MTEPQHLIDILQFCNLNQTMLQYSLQFLQSKMICDLSRKNVPNGSRSNAERNGKLTGDERLGKPFETGNVNG